MAKEVAEVVPPAVRPFADVLRDAVLQAVTKAEEATGATVMRGRPA